MTSSTVGIRDLKARLSHHLRKVKAGAVLVITERNRPIGRIIPIHLGIEGRLKALVSSGLVAWSGKSLPDTAPVAKTRGPRTVAGLLLEDRE